MDLSDFLSELLIVVVFYKTKPRDAVALTSLNAALRDSTTALHIFMYDNSPDPSPSSGRTQHMFTILITAA